MSSDEGLSERPQQSWIRDADRMWVTIMMNSLTDTFTLATALMGAVCVMTWPLFATRSAMLAVQLGIGVFYSIHYALLSAETAAAGNAVSAMQVLLALLASGAPRLRWLGYTPIPIMLVLGALTWDGATSFCATVGTVILALGRAELDPLRLRKLVMSGTVFWLVHDILIWSPLAVVDAISLAVGGLALLRGSAGAGEAATLDGSCVPPPPTDPADRLRRPARTSTPLSASARLPVPQPASPALMSTRFYKP